MPVYDYRCSECNERVERDVKIKDRDAQVCHQCLNPLKRLMTFKGSVWAPTATGGKGFK
jgi:putative FmdB family regulatory protein